jgi:putative flavoprotein involved in K+ transport
VAHTVDVIVIGAGQAGLAASYLLGQEGVPHLVLERRAVGESWRTQRWDSFMLNTPNWANALPGSDFHPEAPDGFVSGGALVGYFEDYAGSHALPVRTGCDVTSVDPLPDGRYRVRTSDEEFQASAVVLASGGLSRPRIPPLAARIAPDVEVLSAAAYRNPPSLPDGAVLVIGAGQSGCQIAEDLLEGGRRVFVSTSRVARVPRSYRGRDAFAWMRELGTWEVRLEALNDPSMEFAPQPQISGTRGGHTLSLQSLAAQGATLVGRVVGIEGHELTLEPNVRACIAFADAKSAEFKSDVDAYIEKNRIPADPALPDPGEPGLPDLGGSDERRDLRLKRSGIASVIWCTGYGADWSWVHAGVFAENGAPRHRRGVTQSKGLYFIGLPWLSKRKSGILYGVGEDAAWVVRHLLEDLGRTPTSLTPEGTRLV